MYLKKWISKLPGCLLIGLRVIILVAFAVSCTKPYDDSEIRLQLEQHEQRIQVLESLCSELNSNIKSLKGAIEAVQGRDYVTGISDLYENGVKVGYTINFAKGSPLKIYNGKDAKAPVIGVSLDWDGNYYWTLDGEWLKDTSGKRMPVMGIPPQLSISNDYWYISYDEGSSWTKLGKATGSDGDSFFKDVEETEDAVILTLSDGSVITLNKQRPLEIIFDFALGFGIFPGESRSINYVLTGGTESTVVKAFGQNGWSARVIPENAACGSIKITAPQNWSDDEIIVLVSDGESRTIMRVISPERGEVKSDVTSVVLKGAGETKTVSVNSNLALSVKSQASWLNVALRPVTRSLTPYGLELTATKNLSEGERATTVTVSDVEGKTAITFAVVQGESDEYEGFVDLSGGGETANCYIINGPGKYKFPIIKGNGHRGLLLSGDTENITGAAAAAVVWQDAGVIGNVGIYKGYVVFDTPATLKKGNALLAVKDDAGKILWSWHIWSTDYVLGQDNVPVFNHSKSNLYYMMPRALGEVNDVALYYQFGRKDPFPVNPLAVSSGAGSLNASIANPEKFFVAGGKDWCNENRTDWWDAGCKTENTSITSASRLKGNKTIYDPCPAGYRVPPDDAFTNFTTTGSNVNNQSYINYKNLSYYSDYDFAYSFYTGFGSTTVNFKSLGGLMAANGEHRNSNGMYYGAHPSGYNTARMLYFHYGYVCPQSNDFSKSMAAAIRPVKDEVKTEDVYYSTDYSKDGTTVKIQSHTVGTGIKVLIAGDGFTDKDIDSGLYDESMNKAAEYFFNVEPFKTYRNRFDVVNLRAVSQTSVFDSQKRTAFQAVYEGGSKISGNLTTAYNKSLQVFGTIQDVLIIIVMNSNRYAGTCYMGGKTVSVAYCPMSEGTQYPFETVIHHEAGGHGFANLGDEYDSQGGTITNSAKEEIASFYASYEWYPNLDCTADRNTIRWAQFLSDSRYSSSVGIYEGAYGYQYGVYRPSSASCMRGMYGEFNAPSRFAIYKRIMTRSGSSWSWNGFVSYDQKNRTYVSPQSAIYPEWSSINTVPHTPPIAVQVDEWLPTTD